MYARLVRHVHLLSITERLCVFTPRSLHTHTPVPTFSSRMCSYMCISFDFGVVSGQINVCCQSTYMYVGEAMCTDDCVNDMQYWYDNEHNC